VLHFWEKPMTRWFIFLASVIACATLLVPAPAGPVKPAAQFEGKSTLLRPEGYREWVFVGSSLGLRYEEGKKQHDQLEYKNVYIDPAAYRAYRQTGAFPQGTVLVLETAIGEEKKEPGLRGSFQKQFTGLSAAVKDKDRFPDGWAYFSFSDGPGKTKSKAPPAKKAACYDCHRLKGAEDNVFTQFYPVLKEAKDGDTLQGTWLPSEAELAGKKFSDEVRKTIKLVVKDDKYTVTVGKQVDKGTTKLNPKANPKALDITGTEGPNKGKTILAIYERDGDTLRVCYDLSGKSRPTEFKTSPGTQLFLVTYKQEKP
jgi:uncharacterized protein (TIGR03067 family)